MQASNGNIEKQVVNAVRRASVAVSKAAQAAVQKFVKTGAPKRQIVGTETRLVPVSTVAAQELARASISIIAPAATQIIKKQHFESIALKHKIRHHHKNIAEDDQDSDNISFEDEFSESFDDISVSSNDLRSCSSVQMNEIGFGMRTKDIVISDSPYSDNRFLSLPTTQLLQELTDDVALQRKFLPDSELDNFDHQWGIDPTGEFVREERIGNCIKLRSGAKEIISHEIDKVKKLTRQKIDKLKLATDEHTGLEILHLFVLDLLGRDTAAARIFDQKSDEDFKRTLVVSARSKIGASITLLLINIFFAYYAVLYGFSRGIEWQKTFLSACIAQMFVEIFINETLEVAWMNFFVPTLVAEDVRTVRTAVLDSVSNLCNLSMNLNNNSGKENTEKNAYKSCLLNAPNYLFVSTNVARSYPSLMESFIVQTFVSHLPGEISKKWHIGVSEHLSLHAQQGPWTWLRLNMSLAVTFTLMKYLATAPSMLQRMFIRSAQPFFVSGIVMTYYVVAESPLYIGLFSAGLAVLMVYFIYRYIQGFNERKQHLTIHPLKSFVEDEKEEIFDIGVGEADESDGKDEEDISFFSDSDEEENDVDRKVDDINKND